jgi:hypothetical protein
MTTVGRVECEHENKRLDILDVLGLPPFLVHELPGPGFPGRDVGF